MNHDPGTHDRRPKKCPSHRWNLHIRIDDNDDDDDGDDDDDDDDDDDVEEDHDHGIVSKGRRRDVTNDPNLLSRPES